jgi:hypothetical protein
MRWHDGNRRFQCTTKPTKIRPQFLPGLKAEVSLCGRLDDCSHPARCWSARVQSHAVFGVYNRQANVERETMMVING